MPPVVAALKGLKMTPAEPDPQHHDWRASSASSSSASRWKPQLSSPPVPRSGRTDNLEEARLGAIEVASAAEAKASMPPVPEEPVYSGGHGGKGAVHHYAQSGSWLHHWDSTWNPKKDGY